MTRKLRFGLGTGLVLATAATMITAAIAMVHAGILQAAPSFGQSEDIELAKHWGCLLTQRHTIARSDGARGWSKNIGEDGLIIAR